MADPTADPTAYTRRLSLLDPGYRREALREIRRIVPTTRGRPFVNLYEGSDEPVTVLPRGTARRTGFGRRLAREFPRGDRVRPARPVRPAHLQPARGSSGGSRGRASRGTASSG